MLLFTLCMPIASLYSRYDRACKDDRLILAIQSKSESKCMALIGYGARGSAKGRTSHGSFVAYVKYVVATGQLNRIHSDYEATAAEDALAYYYDVPFGGSGVPVALVKTGANPDGVNAIGTSVLACAIKLHQHDAVSALVSAGANTLEAIDPTNLPDLHDLTLLLEHGASANIPSETGETPIFYADAEETEVLIKHGAAVNITNVDGETPLMFAVDSQPQSIRRISALLRSGGSDTRRDPNGASALLMACRFAPLEVVELLAHAGSNTRAKDRFGNTALIRSMDNADPRVFKWLLRQGADINEADKYGNTPLGIIDLILQHPRGFDLNDVSATQRAEFAAELKRRGAVSLIASHKWPGFDAN